MSAAVPNGSGQGAPVRLALFGTGRSGREVLKGASRRSDLEIVAAVVTSPVKAGLDVGELAGLGLSGVRATTDLDEVLGREDVDAVVYCGLGSPAEVAQALGRCAAAGKDAVTVTGLVHPRAALGEEGAAALERAALAGSARVLGAGWNPGFLMDVLPVIWAAGCTRIDRIHVERVAEMRWWGEGVHRELGLGDPPSDFPSHQAVPLEESLALIEDALRFEFDRSEHSHEPILSTKRRTDGKAVVEEGRIVGFASRSVGYRGGLPLVELEVRAIFCIDPALDGSGELARLRIEGEPSICTEAQGSFLADSYTATAARALNSIIPLRSLPPGVYRPDQLPLSAY